DDHMNDTLIERTSLSSLLHSPQIVLLKRLQQLFVTVFSGHLLQKENEHLGPLNLQVQTLLVVHWIYSLMLKLHKGCQLLMKDDHWNQGGQVLLLVLRLYDLIVLL